MKYRLLPYYNINIPLREEYVQSLVKRFDPEYDYVDCILCVKYYQTDKVNPCETCPIGMYGIFTCQMLARKILQIDNAIDVEMIAVAKCLEMKQYALKLKEWFESLPKYELKEIK